MLDSELMMQLRDIVGDEGIRERAPMTELTTFRIGGPAEAVVEPASIQEAAQVFAACKSANVRVRVLGLGSDLLVSDDGLDGVVVRFAERFSAISVDPKSARITVEAGANNTDVAEAACAAGLTGYEFASGIPGTIGGAAIMNAGAYGGEFRNVCSELVCLTPDGEVVRVRAYEACWGYRRSMMFDAGYVVLGATLQLMRGEMHEIRSRMDDLAQQRSSKQPLEMPSAGSTFKRPKGYFAGKLIQDAGLRGFSVGGAQVSEKHTGFVVNRGDAKAADVLALIKAVQDKVFENEGVRMYPEVRMWGFSDAELASVGAHGEGATR